MSNVELLFNWFYLLFS